MVSHIRGFTTAEDLVPRGRTVVGGAPDGLRREFVDLVFSLIEHNHLDAPTIHQAATQSLGKQAAAKPYAGRRHALGRDITEVEWPRVYLNGEVVDVLDSVNTLRHRNFGHGGPFSLRPEEVEFTYTLCAAGIGLLAR